MVKFILIFGEGRVPWFAFGRVARKPDRSGFIPSIQTDSGIEPSDGPRPPPFKALFTYYSRSAFLPIRLYRIVEIAAINDLSLYRSHTEPVQLPSLIFHVHAVPRSIPDTRPVILTYVQWAYWSLHWNLPTYLPFLLCTPTTYRIQYIIT
jgi:hypothetical protein